MQCKAWLPLILSLWYFASMFWPRDYVSSLPRIPPVRLPRLDISPIIYVAAAAFVSPPSFHSSYFITLAPYNVGWRWFCSLAKIACRRPFHLQIDTLTNWHKSTLYYNKRHHMRTAPYLFTTPFSPGGPCNRPSHLELQMTVLVNMKVN